MRYYSCNNKKNNVGLCGIIIKIPLYANSKIKLKFLERCDEVNYKPAKRT
jgi:hypothetical protein